MVPVVRISLSLGSSLDGSGLYLPSLLYFSGDSRILGVFRVKIAIVGCLMFSCGSPARFCWAEVEYDWILAVGGRDFELWLLKIQKNIISSIFSLKYWQVWSGFKSDVKVVSTWTWKQAVKSCIWIWSSRQRTQNQTSYFHMAGAFLFDITQDLAVHFIIWFQIRFSKWFYTF